MSEFLSVLKKEKGEDLHQRYFCLVVEISLIKLLFSSRVFSHQGKEPQLELTLWLKLWR